MADKIQRVRLPAVKITDMVGKGVLVTRAV